MVNPAASEIRKIERSLAYQRMDFRQKKQFHREEINYHMSKYWELDEQEREAVKEAQDAKDHAREIERL